MCETVIYQSFVIAARFYTIFFVNFVFVHVCKPHNLLKNQAQSQDFRTELLYVSVAVAVAAAAAVVFVDMADAAS